MLCCHEDELDLGHSNGVDLVLEPDSYRNLPVSLPPIDRQTNLRIAIIPTLLLLLLPNQVEAQKLLEASN